LKEPPAKVALSFIYLQYESFVICFIGSAHLDKFNGKYLYVDTYRINAGSKSISKLDIIRLIVFDAISVCFLLFLKRQANKKSRQKAALTIISQRVTSLY
jgi:hypothetical protein